MREIGFWLYLVFVASWFLHVTSRVPALGDLRVDLALVVLIAAVTLAGGMSDQPAGGDKRIRRSMTALGIYALVTVPFVQWPGSVLWFGIPSFAKALVFYFFTAWLVDDERKLGRLLLVFLACQTFRVVEPVYLHLTQGYWGSLAMMADWEAMDRLAGAPNDVVNPNGLAFVILTVLPFLHYLGPLSKVGAVAYIGILPLLMYALVLTGSRSGLLGLVVTVCGIWIQSAHKLLLGAAIAVAVVLSVSQLSENLSDRYRSIISMDTKNAPTAKGRIEGVWTDLAVAARRPLFGHGLGTSLEANANFAGIPQRSHNLYTEVAQELGFIGLGVFLIFLGTLGVQLVVTSRRLRQAPEVPARVTRLVQALRVWFAMNLLFSLASYGLSSYEWYFLAGLLDVVARLVPASREGEAASGTPVASTGVGATAPQHAG